MEADVNLEAIFGPAGTVPVRAGLVGAGEFGATFLVQARHAEGLSTPVVCDIDIWRAHKTLLAAGFGADNISICSARPAALAALELGRIVVVQDPGLLAQLPLDVVVEATGQPEAAALTIISAIQNGLHTVIATKEAEIVAGPIFARKARAAGLVHTIVDGDQPSLLVGLAAWARILGMRVVAAAKAGPSDYVWDAEAGTITNWNETVQAPHYDKFFRLRDDDIVETLSARKVAGLPSSMVADLCEMGIVANHTELVPDRPELHAPIARTCELPSIFRPRESGGILGRDGVVDIYNCLRRPDEMSPGGGVIVTVEIPDASAGRFFCGRGTPASPDGRFLLLQNPVHLLGAEATVSVLIAKRLGVPTGGSPVRQRFDLVAKARRNMQAGETLDVAGHMTPEVSAEKRHAIDTLDHLLLPARPLGPGSPVPYYLAQGLKVCAPIPAGTVVTCDQGEFQTERLLLKLRQEQDVLLPM